MCGIAGLWNRDGKPAEAAVLRRMADVQAHRGPDDQGLYTHGDLGLAHRRLSIIDPSERGRQPMATSDGRFRIVFNGEIHNFIELREELERGGARFQSGADTEVALEAYARWGTECFERFNGMWAMALWDARREELLLCRDRFGIIPLLYSVRGPRWVFASEAKAIVCAFAEEREPDWKQVHRYVRFGTAEIGEATFFDNIKMLPPGRFMRVTRPAVEERTYWNFEPGEEAPRPNAPEEFRALVTDAVKIRLRSDAPLSVWLSGGLDSSVIARVARSLVNRPLPCYALRHEDRSADESAYAAAVADDPEAYAVHWITPRPANFVDVLDRLVWDMDAPPVRTARIAIWHMARECSASMKVALTGNGADELLGGYAQFALPYLADRIVRPGPAGCPGPLGLLREWADLRQVYPAAQRHRWARVVLPPRFFRGLAGDRGNVCAPAFEQAWGPVEPELHRFGAWAGRNGDHPYRSFLNNALWREFTWGGLPEMLRGFDAMSMAHSLELRSPFLDHRIVEYCFSLPYHEKIRAGWTKSLLRRAFADLLPPLVRDRRPKLGFPAPLDGWFRRADTFAEARALLMGGECVRLGCMDARRLDRGLKQIETPRGVPGAPGMVHLVRWVAMECWFRRFGRLGSR